MPLRLLPRLAYPHPVRVETLESFTDEDWADDAAAVVYPNANPPRGRGENAVAAHQRRSRERKEC